MKNNGGNTLLKFLTNPIVIGGFFSLDVIIVRFYIYPKYYAFLEKDIVLIQNFIEWFGVAYGLFIALVLVNVWSQFENTEREFDREADAIFMLYQSAKQIKESNKNIKRLKKEIITAIKAYVLHVNQNYVLEHQKLDIRDAGDAILEQIRDGIGDLIHTQEKLAITAELVKEFNEVIDIRGDRISLSKQRVPQPVWAISYTSSILWLIPFLGLNFVNNLIAIVLVGGVTIVVIAILAIIKDLDDPFEGAWKIDSTEWELLGDKIELNPVLVFVFNMDNSRLYRTWAEINGMFSNRVCALYSILNKDDQLLSLYNELGDLARLRILYKDEFEVLYEKRYPLPVVLYKLGNTSKQLIENTELNRINDLQELNETIRQRL